MLIDAWCNHEAMEQFYLFIYYLSPIGIYVSLTRFLLIFMFMWPCIVTNLFLIKPTDTLISQIYFVKKLHVSGSSSAYHQEFSTVHPTLVYIMQVWWQLSSTTSCAWKLSSHLHDIYHCRMYSEKLLMIGGGTARNM